MTAAVNFSLPECISHRYVELLHCLSALVHYFLSYSNDQVNTQVTTKAKGGDEYKEMLSTRVSCDTSN